MKRGDKKIMLKNNKRLPSRFKLVPFIKGDETLDIDDIDCLVGSYWYDCEAFNNTLIIEPFDIADDLEKLSI